jgi:hypothetical protein
LLSPLGLGSSNLLRKGLTDERYFCGADNARTVGARARRRDRREAMTEVSDLNEQELEELISDLADRRKQFDEDSAEYKMIVRQLAGIRREGYLAARILEEYDYWG